MSVSAEVSSSVLPHGHISNDTERDLLWEANATEDAVAPEDKEDEEEEELPSQNGLAETRMNHSEPEQRCSAENALKDPPKQTWLLRLFESKLFDMSIAITYLYNSKESGQWHESTGEGRY